MNDDRLITVWILVICTIFGVSLGISILVYGPKWGLTAAMGFLGAKLLSHLRA